MKKIILFYILSLFLYTNTLKTAWLQAPVKPAKEMDTPTARRIVNSIKAKSLDKKIILTWKKVENKKIKYMLYRDTKIINSAEKLKLTQLIKTLPYNKDIYIDSVSKKEKYYYAITVVDENQKEDKLLLSNKNYTTSPVIPGEKIITNSSPDEKKIITENEPVNFISATIMISNVLLEWEDSNPDYYNIYRNTQIISNKEVLSQSKFLNKINKGIQKYIDLTSTDGNYYYAIINVNLDNESIVLIPDSNYTTIPAVFIAPKTMENTNKEMALVKPEPELIKKEIKTTTPIIKRESEKKEIKSVKKKKKIAKKRKYKLKNNSINYMIWLDNTIKKYYFKNNTHKSIKEFNRIIKSKASKKIKAKAKLFLGRIYFKKKSYRKALKYFSESKDKYPEESEFWMKNILKKIQ